jgi:hypothetical protein
MIQHKLRLDWWSSASTTLVLSRSSFPSSLAGLRRAWFLASEAFTRTHGGRKTLAETFAPKVLPKWKEPEEALRQSISNDIYRFFNYCMKLKRGQDGRHLKGISKASALRADWKGFRGYYRQINRKKISLEDSKERRSML